MVYLYYGTNIDAINKKVSATLGLLRTKKPDAEFFSFDAGQYNDATIQELAGGQGLFERKYIVLCDRVSEDTDKWNSVLSRLPEMAESPHIFILREGTLAGVSKKKCEQYAEQVMVLDKKKTNRKFSVGGNNSADIGDFKIFSLGDALGARDKKKLWVLHQISRRHTIPPEEVHGILMWQIKNMIIARDAAGADEARMKAFVFQKSKRYAKNFTVKELQDLSRTFVRLYHDAHRGMVDFDTALEKIILTL